MQLHPSLTGEVHFYAYTAYSMLTKLMQLQHQDYAKVACVCSTHSSFSSFLYVKVAKLLAKGSYVSASRTFT